VCNASVFWIAVTASHALKTHASPALVFTKQTTRFAMMTFSFAMDRKSVMRCWAAYQPATRARLRISAMKTRILAMNVSRTKVAMRRMRAFLAGPVGTGNVTAARPLIARHKMINVTRRHAIPKARREIATSALPLETVHLAMTHCSAQPAIRAQAEPARVQPPQIAADSPTSAMWEHAMKNRTPALPYWFKMTRRAMMGFFARSTIVATWEYVMAISETAAD
jgi:hypothetical protein